MLSCTDDDDDISQVVLNIIIKETVMSKCEHGQKISYFCATDCCLWKEASGCEACIRKYHNHMGATIFLTEEDINLILKKFTLESHSKPKCRMLQEAVYSYFSSIKTEISNSIDIVCKNLIYQIGYPYLNANNALPIYRRLKNKEYRKIAQKDFKTFYELTQKITDKQLANQQAKIYLKQLNMAAQLMESLQDTWKQYESSIKRYQNNFVHDGQPAERIKQILKSLNLNQQEKGNQRQIKKIDNLFSPIKDKQQDQEKHQKTLKKPFQLQKNMMPVLASPDRPNYSRDVSIDKKILKQPLFGGLVQIVQKQSSQKQIPQPKQGGYLQRQRSERIQNAHPEMNSRQLQISEKKKMLMEMMRQKEQKDSIKSVQKKLSESVVIAKEKIPESLVINKEKPLSNSVEANLSGKKQLSILKPPNFQRKCSINQNMTNSLTIPERGKLLIEKQASYLNKSSTLNKKQQNSKQITEVKSQNEQIVMNIEETKSLGFQNQDISDKSQKGSDQQPEQEEENEKNNTDRNYAFTKLPVEQKAPKGLKLEQRVGKKLIVIPALGLQKDQITSPILKKKSVLDRYKESLKGKETIFENKSQQIEEKYQRQQKQTLKQSGQYLKTHRRTDSCLQLKENQEKSLALLLKSLNLKAEEAIIYLQKSIFHAQNNLSAAEYLSFLYLQLERPLDCLKLCNKTLQKIENSNEPDDLSLIINNNKASALNILGRYSESIVLLERCLKHREKDFFYKNLGDAYFSISIYEKAIYNYEKALKLNDQLDEAHYNLAVCLFGQLNYNNAKLSIMKAIQLNPTNLQYSELLKNIVTRINNY